MTVSDIPAAAVRSPDRIGVGIAAIAEVNPITLCVDAVRALTIGGHAAGPVLGTLA